MPIAGTTSRIKGIERHLIQTDDKQVQNIILKLMRTPLISINLSHN